MSTQPTPPEKDQLPEGTVDFTPPSAAPADGTMDFVAPAPPSSITVGSPPETQVESARKQETPPGEAGFTLNYDAPGLAQPSTDEPQPGSAGYIEPTLDIRRAREANSTAFALAFGADQDEATGDTHKVPGYEILEILGRGAMGVVYKARQRGLKRIVALKMILSGEHAGEADLARFRMEAEAVGQLQHPNIVQVYEVGELNGCPYLALEYIDGGSLQAKLAGAPQPVLPAAQLMQVLAQAMNFAHSKGIIHRDLKPANVMLMSVRNAATAGSMSLSGAPLAEQVYGVPKIADFGLAKRLEEESGQTRSGAILGTPSYMAPEQAEGMSKEVGPFADQYALGAMLYEFLTGRPPFQGATIWETLDMVRTTEPVPPTRLQPKIPRDLETICLKALQKEPQKRYESCGAMADDLRRFLQGEPILARPVSTTERLWRWCRRNPYIAAMSGTIAVLLVAVAVVSTVFAFRLAAEKADAEHARDEADTQRGIADANAKRAETNRQLAVHHAEVAEGQRQLAMDTLETLVTEVQDKLQDSQAYQLRRDLLNIALKGFQKVAKKTSDEQLLGWAFAAAHDRFRQLFKQLGSTGDEFQQALLVKKGAEEELAAHPKDIETKANAAVALAEVGDTCLRQQGQRALALQCLRQALRLRQELVSATLTNPQFTHEDALAALAQSEDYIGNTVLDPSERFEAYHKAYQLRQERVAQDKRPQKQGDAQRELAESWGNMGDAYRDLGRWQEARKWYAKVRALWAQFLPAHPHDLSLRWIVAYFDEKLADIQLLSGHPTEARDGYQRVRQTYKDLNMMNPKDARIAESVARIDYKFATAWVVLHDRTRAIPLLDEAKKLLKGRLELDPSNALDLHDLLRCQACGSEYQAAAAGAKKLQAEAPDDPYALSIAARVYSLCAETAARLPEKSAAAARRQQYLTAGIDALTQATRHGYAMLAALESDPDFDGLRGQPAFVKLLENIRHNHPALVRAKP
jgi:eukaryotic-like serine/threonine-protein kinase